MKRKRNEVFVGDIFESVCVAGDAGVVMGEALRMWKIGRLGFKSRGLYLYGRAVYIQ